MSICKYCGQGGLRWKQTDKGWRLHDQETPHCCKERKKRKDDPATKANNPNDHRGYTRDEAIGFAYEDVRDGLNGEIDAYDMGADF